MKGKKNDKMKNNLIKYIVVTMLLAAFGLVTLSSSVYLYQMREEIADKIGTNEYSIQPADEYWAREGKTNCKASKHKEMPFDGNLNFIVG